MATRRKSPEKSEAPPPSGFRPSSLPSTLEHATLASHLLARVGNMVSLNDEAIRSAVATAAKLWAAVVEHNTERSVEEARLSFAANRADAEARWHQWHRQHLGLEQTHRKWEKEQDQWEARAAACFKNREFPACGDQVLQWIMAGEDDNVARTPETRHMMFSEAWLKWASDDTRRRLAHQWGHPPDRGTVLLEASRRQPSAEDLPVEPWPYDGEAGMALLDADVDAARKEYQDRAAAAMNAELDNLKTISAGFRTESLSYHDALRWYIIWKKHLQHQGRLKGADSTKAKARGAKKNIPPGK